MIGFVAQDMGGANLVLHHAKFTNKDKTIFAFGPAKSLCKLLNLENFLTNNTEFDFDLIIAGANFKNSKKTSDKLLINFMKKNIPIHGYLDGWEFLNERYKNTKIENYLVTDNYAFSIVNELYPGRVKLVQNYYFDQVKLDYGIFKNGTDDSVADSVLYLTQPNITNDSNLLKLMHGQNCICDDLFKIKDLLGPKKIIVRDHVRLDSLKCIGFFRTKSNIVFKHTSATSPLASDLIKCEVVCGPPNPALFLAQQLSLKTFTTKELPKNWKGPNFIFLN
jgi:hypothetical protein